ncbi:gamma-type small acid-soluble spore protein [Fervidibacillus halotolerans]|uniref:Small, acid-soluble spore protein gamma-type n=1 Tax=Fervidibacillus halotolerans TaxID=2980027 RepID=A0A9E8M118_9BACI|nr:gamma-type small acid-soluble spore protein [Fervidibacillus halotolerans]WAA12935.1 gamma-type small acid-soluble spore protein [Fervidibacillus halotolerans]
MAKQKRSSSGTNIENVRRQNAQSAQGQQDQYGTEFASETDAQQVRKQNQKAESKKKRNS